MTDDYHPHYPSFPLGEDNEYAARYVRKRRRAGGNRRRKVRLAKEFGCICYLCGRHFQLTELTIEHKTPLSRHGTNDDSNLALACGPCNTRKGDMTEAEYRNQERNDG